MVVVTVVDVVVVGSIVVVVSSWVVVVSSSLSHIPFAFSSRQHVEPTIMLS